MAKSLGGAGVRAPGGRYGPRERRAESRLLSSSRARLRFALLLCLGIAGLFAFVVLPPERVSVRADGSETVVVNRGNDSDAILKRAGVERGHNDVLVRQGNELRLERAIPVVAEVDRRVLGWRTRAGTVGALLAEMDIRVGPYDTVVFNGLEVGLDAPIMPGPFGAVAADPAAVFGPAAANDVGIALVVFRAVPFSLVEDGRPVAMQSSRPTVGLALRDAGIVLGPADEVYPPVSSDLIAGQQVTVRHAFAVSIRTGDSYRLVYTHKKVLSEALAEAGLTLGDEDRVEPSLDAAVFNGMTARLVRVAGRQFLERDPVKRKTVFKPDESLQGTQSRVVQGQDGVRVREYRIVIEDGVETERRLLREYVDPEPVDSVIYYAASAVRATGLPAETLNVSRVERMWVTWYNAASSGRPATDPHYGITASGVPVTKGIVAVDPRVIPLGTRLYIPGYGFGIAADTGGGVIGNMVDVGFPDGVAVDFQTGHYDIYILAH